MRSLLIHPWVQLMLSVLRNEQSTHYMCTCECEVSWSFEYGHGLKCTSASCKMKNTSMQTHCSLWLLFCTNKRSSLSTLDEASSLNYFNLLWWTSTTVGDIQSPETILPTRKIGSLKRLDAAKITEHGLHKRKKQKKQKCTTSAIALYMKAMIKTLQCKMIKVGASGTVSYLHVTHEIKGIEKKKKVMKCLLRILANPIQR